jgi:hypothetical protein
VWVAPWADVCSWSAQGLTVTLTDPPPAGGRPVRARNDLPDAMIFQVLMSILYNIDFFELLCLQTTKNLLPESAELYGCPFS